MSFSPQYGNLESSSKLLPFKLINMKEISIGDHEGEIDTILARLNQTALPGEGGDPLTQFLGGAFTIVDIVGVILKYIPICSIYLAPSPDPTAFRGVLSIQKGNYDIQLHPGFVSHSEFFDYVKYIVGKEDKIAVVGKNELAVTMLFKILMGEEEPDSGTVRVRPKRISTLAAM